MSVTHEVPTLNSGGVLTECCKRPVFELPRTDRMTITGRVTCTGGPSEWDRHHAQGRDDTTGAQVHCAEPGCTRGWRHRGLHDQMPQKSQSGQQTIPRLIVRWLPRQRPRQAFIFYRLSARRGGGTKRRLRVGRLLITVRSVTW